MVEQSWEGPERRSPESILARTAVATKARGDELEQRLSELPRRARWERKRLREEAAEARREERNALFLLREGSDSG